MKTGAIPVDAGGSNVRRTDVPVSVRAGLVVMCPLNVVAADDAAGLTSKSSPTLLMMLSRSSSDLAVESRSDCSAYLLSEGGSAIVLTVEFESFLGRRWEDVSQPGPVSDEVWP